MYVSFVQQYSLLMFILFSSILYVSFVKQYSLFMFILFSSILCVHYSVSCLGFPMEKQSSFPGKGKQAVVMVLSILPKKP